MIKAVIFDLDGVLVSTDEFHYLAWKAIAQREGIEFNREINMRLRGVSRMESLEIILERASKTYTKEDRNALASEKNSFYVEYIQKISKSDALPGALDSVISLKEAGIKVAIGSSSRNTRVILDKMGITDWFDAIADGNEIINSKPEPDVFLLAANKLSIDPSQCLVVEDADAGVQAAIKAGMRVLAIGSANGHHLATRSEESLASLSLLEWIGIL